MSPQRADGSWIGLLVFLFAIVGQIVAAMRKGKAARPPVPGTYRPNRAPAPAPAPVAARPLPQSPPQPWRPAPVVVNFPRPRPETAPAPLPPKLREMFEELSVPEPLPSELVPPRSGPSDEEIAAAARRMEAAEAGSPSPSTSAAAPASAAAWARLRLQTRQEWQRAFVLSEVLQPPVALRPAVPR